MHFFKRRRRKMANNYVRESLKFTVDPEPANLWKHEIVISSGTIFSDIVVPIYICTLLLLKQNKLFNENNC